MNAVNASSLPFRIRCASVRSSPYSPFEPVTLTEDPAVGGGSLGESRRPRDDAARTRPHTPRRRRGPHAARVRPGDGGARTPAYAPATAPPA